MVETLLEFGYCVDVIDHLNTTFVPYEPYSIVIDARSNLERLAPLLHGHCVKVMHLDTAHFLFHNAAEARRLLDLQRRRGVALGPRRFEAANLGIETADCGTTSGNEWTISTFRYARKPIYRLPVPAAASFAWREDKDWEKCRRQFLWLNGRGLVHKGLDLVLEAFAAMPEYHLTVCGPLDEEKDFTRVYHEELYETPNIHPVGWIDVTGPEFSAIAANCMGTVLASCSENASGSAVNCMHAGLVPIVSRECGVDVDDFGVLLNDCSVENIKNTVRSVASRPADEIKDRARAAWEFARANHTRARYAETYREVVARILGHQEARAIQFLPGIMRSA